MPGRQAHGRPLIAAPKAKAAGKKSKARSQKTVLDAFGIAQQQFQPQDKKTPRARELDADIERKHGRDDEDDDHGQDEDEAPVRKKAKRPPLPPAGVDYGSDSEGNEWCLGGLAEDDNDSEIDSDEAFGESDDERFQGFSFRGSKSKPPEDGSDDDSQDDQGATLGDDAIDLATALDQFEEDSDDPQDDGPEPKVSDDEAQDDDDETDQSSSDDDGDEDDGELDEGHLVALEDLVSGYAGESDGKDADQDASASSHKIELGDLGLSGITDAFMSKSVKLLKKEERAKRPGASKKLSVPLAKRQQDRLDRAVAYEKTNETLNRWTETVKQNRRAEHLIFPLPQNSDMAGLDTTEIQPLTLKTAGTELETTIMSIMEQSGLSLEKKPKSKPHEVDEDGNVLSRKQALLRRRKERELNAREAKRAKRIKKIKSKAYHRVHRKERERLEMAEKAAMEEAGEMDSEEERQAQDRRRALERVGQRHKDSKWAKMGSKVKRAVWDDDYRAGLTEMARKDEELRRRKEGKKGTVDDSDETSSSGSDSDEDNGMRRDLDHLEQLGEENEKEPQSGLMSLKFMQKAEAAQKAANDDLIKQIHRQLDGEDGSSSEHEPEEIGRRSYGTKSVSSMKPVAIDMAKQAARRGKKKGDAAGNAGDEEPSMPDDEAEPTISLTAAPPASIPGKWSQNKPRRRKKDTSTSKGEDDLDLTAANAAVKAAPPPPSSSAAKPQQPHRVTDPTPDSDNDSAASELHLPLAVRDQQVLERAFAGDDVVAQFEQEKQAAQVADDDQVVDATLPGWGSWVGEGVSERERLRHSGRFVRRVEGIKPENRRDAKLKGVIISEKRAKKNDRFRASQLPHPFETRQQYERALRLPVGPEWMTRQSFQEGIQPRVLVKQGVITAMAKPTA